MKGAFVVYASHRSMDSPTVIQFQYNPDQLTRQLSHRSPRTGADTSRSRGEAQEDVLRVEGPPRETISLSVVVNIADQLELAQRTEDVAKYGLHPVLAALERLLFPPKREVERNQRQAEQGTAQLASAALRPTMLVWGDTRVVPVRINSISVAEEGFDPSLNPIQAKVDLNLQVLTVDDLPTYNRAMIDSYKGYWAQRERLADKYQQGGKREEILERVRILRTLGSQSR